MDFITDNIQVKYVDYNNPTEEEANMLIENMSDFDGVKNMAGLLPAIISGFISVIYPSKLLEIYTDYYNARAEKIKAISIHPFINNMFLLIDTCNGKCMGRLTLSTYAGERPKEYENVFMIEIGLFLGPDYRNKGITQTVNKKILSKLLYDDAIFCFRTRKDNVVMHHVANKIGAKMIHTFESFEETSVWSGVIIEDLFILTN